ncbi:uncharacterized protein TNIN_31871 [Trichonephila inaurata madagascariensis]|uniref:Uncharacterized protein n=1 Tax=Trichonephila inaurata madagascariensis TaxID=2747483 RepID=A0A8X6MFR6_9ARAC|nr:uncharacterized protein TNIN_31871 [Trichonephila inaurata madagascariensis]
MANDNAIYLTAKFVLSFVLYKYKIIKTGPKLEAFGSTINDSIGNLKNIVWIESHAIRAEWGKFLKKHFDDMISSPKLYATYVIFACYVKNEVCQNSFDCFLNTLTIVAEFAVYTHTHQKGCSAFIDMSAEIFQAFYEKELSKKFYSQGGWKEFSKFMYGRSSLQNLDAVNLLTNNAKTPSEVACILYLPFSDSGKIGSYVLNVISETVQTHKQTLSLVETILGVLDETAQWEDADEQIKEKGRLINDIKIQLMKHLKDLYVINSPFYFSGPMDSKLTNA